MGKRGTPGWRASYPGGAVGSGESYSYVDELYLHYCSIGAHTSSASKQIVTNFICLWERNSRLSAITVLSAQPVMYDMSCTSFTVMGIGRHTRGMRTIAAGGLEATPDRVPPRIHALLTERTRATLRAHEHGHKSVRGIKKREAPALSAYK